MPHSRISVWVCSSFPYLFTTVKSFKLASSRSVWTIYNIDINLLNPKPHCKSFCLTMSNKIFDPRRIDDVYDVTFAKKGHDELQIAHENHRKSSESPGHSSTSSSLDDAKSFRRWYLRRKESSLFGPEKEHTPFSGLDEGKHQKNPWCWWVKPLFFQWFR